MIVINNPSTAPFLLLAIIAWCAKVINPPLESKIKVFKKGIANASKAVIPTGGQQLPISIAGDKLACKYAQNTLKKAITSLKINKLKPCAIPILTFLV